MNTEFIIGTIIGLIGISSIVYGWIQKLRKKSLKSLMDNLVNNENSSDKQRKILSKISIRLLLFPGVMKKLDPEYISNFTLQGRGKEKVFEEMCVSNMIEPTPALCTSILGYDVPSIRERYLNFSQSDLYNATTKQKEK